MANNNFVVKNGIEVANKLLYADSTTNRVGIGTSTPTVELDVAGDVRLDNLTVSEILSLYGNVRLNGQLGSEGDILSVTGTGVTWRPAPGLRSLATFSATQDQFVFNVLYTPANGVDVFLNGARLSASDYVASNGTTVELNVPCYAGDKVDIVSYSVFGESNPGITIKENSVTVGSNNAINEINFVGFTSISLNGSGIGVSVVNSIGNAFDVNIKNQLKLYEDGANCPDHIAFQAPGVLSTSTTYTLPSNYPASTDYVLTSTTSGVMSWVAQTGGGGGGGGGGIVTSSGGISSCSSGIGIGSTFSTILGPDNDSASFKILVEALDPITKDIDFYEGFIVNTVDFSLTPVTNFLLGFNVQAPTSGVFLTRPFSDYDNSNNLVLNIENINPNGTGINIKILITTITCP